MQTWVRVLKREYAAGRRALVQYRDSLPADPDKQTAEDREQLRIAREMIADMAYAIEWMRIGHQPYARRGTEARDAYSRSILMDMDILPRTPPEPELTFTPELKNRIVQVLLKMSERERQCYLLHKAQAMSLADIAKEMRLSKRSVQEYVNRARTKIEQVF